MPKVYMRHARSWYRHAGMVSFLLQETVGQKLHDGDGRRCPLTTPSLILSMGGRGAFLNQVPAGT